MNGFPKFEITRWFHAIICLGIGLIILGIIVRECFLFSLIIGVVLIIYGINEWRKWDEGEIRRKEQKDDREERLLRLQENKKQIKKDLESDDPQRIQIAYNKSYILLNENTFFPEAWKIREEVIEKINEKLKKDKIFDKSISEDLKNTRKVLKRLMGREKHK